MPSSGELSAAWRRISLMTTDSTMLQLRRQEMVAAHTTDFLLLTAGFQTAGRGQHGTYWEAAAGENLLFGIRCRPVFLPAARQFFLSEVQALAVASALDTYVNDITLKWPNDVYYRDRKICGMLLEHDLSGGHITATVTGVGLNVNQTRFGSDTPNPVSLRQILGRPVDCEELLYHICHYFEQYYNHLKRGGEHELHHLYLSRLYRREGFHPYQTAGGRRFLARIAGVAPSGELCLCEENGRESSYAFKEVKFLSM